MLFNVAFIFGLFVVTSVGATGSSSPPNGKGKAASPKTRILKEGEIVEIFTGRLKSYVVRCRSIPRTPPQTLLAFYSIRISSPSLPIFWQFLYATRSMTGDMELLCLSYPKVLHQKSFRHISGGMLRNISMADIL